MTDFEKDTASHDIQNKKWAEPRVDKIHSILSSAMEHSTSPGGVNALKKSIEDARGVYKSIHLAYQEAGSKLAGSIAQAAIILKEELDLKTPDKSTNVTVNPHYLELTTALEKAQKEIDEQPTEPTGTIQMLRRRIALHKPRCQLSETDRTLGQRARARALSLNAWKKALEHAQ